MAELDDKLNLDAPNEDEDSGKADPRLTDWIMEKVDRWREQRDSNHDAEWTKYDRIYRGRYDPSLKIKQAERSRIITPVSQMAVDQSVSEMVDAVFGRGDWFDLADPPPSPQPPPPQPGQPPQPPPPDYQSEEEQVRDNLLEDFAATNLKAEVVKVFLNGAKLGTGIAKRSTVTRIDGTKYITWVPVRPNNFVIDTAAMSVDDALGCAHEDILPLHLIQEKQAAGEYYDTEEISSAEGYSSTSLLQRSNLTDLVTIDAQDGVYFTEYHGKVPRIYMPGYKKPEDKDADLRPEEDKKPYTDDEYDYVEAVVCIANGTIILSAQENALQDRGFIAYQHHTDPDSFWGIGVIEKGFNAQVGLDGEVRARQDALALTTYPIVGIDSTRMPRAASTLLTPGKTLLTNGEPNSIIQPISFGSLNNASFQQSGDMERYLQLATGAVDPAKPVNANSTASGQSQQSSAFLKRAKLTMQNVDTNFLAPMVRKSIIGYNALNPQRYPKIPSFTVNSTMSIMAREFEQAQMTNLLAIIPQQTPEFSIVLKAIITNYSGPQKDQILKAIDESQKPDPEALQMQKQTQQVQFQTLVAGMQKTQAEAKEVQSRVGLNGAKTQSEQVKAKIAPVTAQIQVAQAQNAAKSADTQARQVEVDAAKVQIDHHHREKDHLHKRVSNMIAMQQANKQTPASE